MGFFKKDTPAAQAEAQSKGDAFDARHGASIVRAADKRLKGEAPYESEVKLADMATGRVSKFVKGKRK